MEKQMNLYERNQEHKKNNECFKIFVRCFNWVDIYQPQPEKSPWHWQARVVGDGTHSVIVNFWPHVAKAQRDGEKSVQGWDKIYSIMQCAINENGFDEFEVIE
tara:strand:+ start:365 stop:673 length:309 start_codon:yes stop_codon:yes gene_type:complete